MVSNSALRAGQRVVCIDASVDANGSALLAHKEVYTIMSVYPTGEYVHLAEFPPRWGDPLDRLFRVERFRPIVTKTQEDDVGMFKELTNDIPPSARLEETLAYRLDLLEIAWNASN